MVDRHADGIVEEGQNTSTIVIGAAGLGARGGYARTPGRYAPIRTDYVVVSPHIYTRGFAASLHFFRTLRAFGPVSPDTLSVAFTTAFGCRREGYSLMGLPTFSWMAPHSGPPTSWGTKPLEGALPHKRILAV